MFFLFSNWDLHFTLRQLRWVITAYVIILCVHYLYETAQVSFFLYILSGVSSAILKIYSESIKTFYWKVVDHACAQREKNLILQSKWLKVSTTPLSLLLFDHIAIFEISIIFSIVYKNNYFKLQNHCSTPLNRNRFKF